MDQYVFFSRVKLNIDVEKQWFPVQKLSTFMGGFSHICFYVVERISLVLPYRRRPP
jgi:hypothetical protein